MLFLLIFLVFLTITCSAGIIYGFNSLKLILVAEGIYDATSSELELIPIIVFNAASLSCVVSGFSIDYFGIKLNAIMGITVFTLGMFSLYEKYILGGLLLLAIGGMQLVLCEYQFANACSNEKHAVWLRSSINAAYNASGLVFYVISKMYQHYHSKLEIWFLGYFLFGVVMMLVVAKMFPIRPCEKNYENETTSAYDNNYNEIYSWNTLFLGLYFGFMLLLSNVLYVQVPLEWIDTFQLISSLGPIPIIFLLPYHFQESCLGYRRCIQVVSLVFAFTIICFLNKNTSVLLVMGCVFYTYGKTVFINLVYHLLFERYAPTNYGRAVALVTAITIPIGLIQLAFVNSTVYTYVNVIFLFVMTSMFTVSISI